MLGTRAQFIKSAPVMQEMLRRKVKYTLIYSAQHQENIDEILDIFKLPKPDIVLYKQGEANTKKAFFHWFMAVFSKILFFPKAIIQSPGVLLTHGDTSTTWLAALLGKRSGCTIGHIESGLRSYNMFSPFPEEINRLITFALSDIYFCSSQKMANNLRKYKGEKVVIRANTMLDGIRYALRSDRGKKNEFEKSRYALVSIHRFENIFTHRLTEIIIPTLKEIAQKKRVVLVLHPTTRERLLGLGIYNELKDNDNITVSERFDFVDWVNIANGAEFVITDGGSNQEELSYLGVPTLLFRYETEREEGLGRNIVLSKFNKEIIDDFLKNLPSYKKHLVLQESQPSKDIVSFIYDTFCV